MQLKPVNKRVTSEFSHSDGIVRFTQYGVQNV